MKINIVKRGLVLILPAALLTLASPVFAYDSHSRGGHGDPGYYYNDHGRGRYRNHGDSYGARGDHGHAGSSYYGRGFSNGYDNYSGGFGHGGRQEHHRRRNHHRRHQEH